MTGADDHRYTDAHAMFGGTMKSDLKPMVEAMKDAPEAVPFGLTTETNGPSSNE